MAVAEAMMPRLFFRLIQHMRASSSSSDDAVSAAMADADNFLHFLHQLSDMGAAMRKVLANVLTQSNIYHKLTEGELKCSGHYYKMQEITNLCSNVVI